jgi:hypothetical protein
MKMDSGFRIQIVGDKPFISRVRPGTDAESKVHPGDEVLQYNGYTVDRDGLWKMNYYFNRLAPRPGSQLRLRNLNDAEREVKVDAKVRKGKVCSIWRTPKD